MKHTHLGQCLLEAIGREQTTQRAIAVKAGISHPSITRMIANGQRPEPDTLLAVCHAFERPNGARVLLGHLRDEIERAGFLLREIDVRIRGIQSVAPCEIEKLADRGH